MSTKPLLIALMLMAIVGPVSAFTTNLGNATVVISYYTPIEPKTAHTEIADALMFDMFLDQPEIYLIVYEIDSESFSGGIERMTSDFNNRYALTEPWLAIAEGTEPIFGNANLSENAIGTYSDDNDRFFVIDDDISMIIRWINPTMFSVFASRCDPTSLKNVDDATTIVGPEEAPQARLQALMGNLQ